MKLTGGYEYMDNNVLKLILEINFCPYCGSSDIERDRTEEYLV